MKKYFLFLLGFVILGSTHITAYNLDLVTEFMGNTQPAAKFYTKLPWKVFENHDLIFGFSAVIPALKNKELDTDILIGLTTKLPLLGVTDAYFICDNRNATTRTSVGNDSDFYIKSLSLSKAWLFPLNDKIKLGVTTVLAEIMLDGSKELRILQNVSPAMGVTISF